MTLLEQLVKVADGIDVVVALHNGEYQVSFKDSYISEELSGAEKQLYVYGKGTTLEDATRNYITIISGKTLKFTHSDKVINFVVFIAELPVDRR